MVSSLNSHASVNRSTNNFQEVGSADQECELGFNNDVSRSSLGMMKTLALIYKENGVIGGLYRGMSINYLRAIPMVAVSFSTYELMKQALNLDTGMKI